MLVTKSCQKENRKLKDLLKVVDCGTLFCKSKDILETLQI